MTLDLWIQGMEVLVYQRVVYGLYTQVAYKVVHPPNCKNDFFFLEHTQHYIADATLAALLALMTKL